MQEKKEPCRHQTHSANLKICGGCRGKSVATRCRYRVPVDPKSLSYFCNGADYLPAEDAITHSMAFDPVSINIASAGSLYPDHVIFLGDATVVAGENESLDDTVNRTIVDTDNAPVSIVVPHKGVLMKTDANPGQYAMARCIADVTARVPQTATLHYLDKQNVYELLNWEAEHYPQKKNLK